MEDALRELAVEYGVAVEYWDWRNQHVHVRDDTLIAVLAALDVDASTPQACRSALQAKRDAAWRSVLPPYVVLRAGEHREVEVHVADATSADVWIELEDGSYHSNLRGGPVAEPPHEIDGELRALARFTVPADLPLGYHRLLAWTSGERHETPLIVSPAWLGMPARAGDHKFWGLATQLYSVRSTSRGASAISPTSPIWRCGRPPSTVPASCW